MSSSDQALALLEWYVWGGVTETVGKTSRNHFAKPARPKEVVRAAPPAPIAATPVLPMQVNPGLASSPSAAAAKARELADACQTLDALRKSVMEFDGCALKKTAMNTVFADGNPESRVMLIGEAPGAEEDRQGIPFCGASGKLLDRMFAAIDLTRETFYITNTLFWRPPGNRQPTPEELMICRPFVEKHIALVNPRLLVLIGGTAAKAVIETTQGITRLRGRAYTYKNVYLKQEIPVMVTFHPSFLLRQPGQKKLVWQDLLKIEDFLGT